MSLDLKALFKTMHNRGRSLEDNNFFVKLFQFTLSFLMSKLVAIITHTHLTMIIVLYNNTAIK